MARKAFLWSVAGIVLLFTATLAAHHSVSAEFDANKPVTFTGTVTMVQWMNPHIYTHVETKDAGGKTVVYKIEGGNPNSLFRQGWRRDSVKKGDVVTVSGVRAKIPSSLNIGMATITTTDGKKIYGTGAGGGPNPDRVQK